MDTSWTHLLARPLVRPLLGTWVRPNHLTALRLGFGLAACVALAWGNRAGAWWGGGLWLLSAFLDRADGELARLGGLGTPFGHRFDTVTDFTVNTTFFVAIGVGLRHGWLGRAAIPLGLIAAATVLTASVCNERIERHGPKGVKAVRGRWGFDPDDMMYLMTPLAWLGLLAPLLLAACLGGTTAALTALTRLRATQLDRPGVP